MLANCCRRGGRMRRYHSLAAHAVIVSEEIEALGGLTTVGRLLEHRQRETTAIYATSTMPRYAAQPPRPQSPSPAPWATGLRRHRCREKQTMPTTPPTTWTPVGLTTPKTGSCRPTRLNAQRRKTVPARRIDGHRRQARENHPDARTLTGCDCIPGEEVGIEGNGPRQPSAPRGPLCHREHRSRRTLVRRCERLPM